MGFHKNWLIEQEERGYYYLGEKYVCSDCFNDGDIKQYVKANAEQSECSYCGNVAEDGRLIAAEIDKVMGLIVESIRSEWGDPNNEGVPWESREGGWQLGPVYETRELLCDEIELDINNEELFEDIVNSIGDRQWCQRNFYMLSKDEVLIYGWRDFCKHIKYKTRFFFSEVKDEEESLRGSEQISPAEMLKSLEQAILKTGLLNIIPRETQIFRARAVRRGIKITQTRHIGPPLPHQAKYANRMSPAGIPMFYGAFDRKTARREIFSKKSGKDTFVGLFKVLKDLKVIDFTKLPAVPSIFNEEKRCLRPAIIFLHSFIKDLSKSIKKDGREHIDYVPTQIMTEYFRHVYKDSNEENVMGIVYPSARAGGHVSLVLFLEQKDCGVIKKSKGKWLGLESIVKL